MKGEINIDRVVNNITAFRTLSEMVEVMKGGYVPTIYPSSRHGRKPAKGRVRLIQTLRVMGFRVYTGE